jgi:serine/threonine protein kinase
MTGSRYRSPDRIFFSHMSDQVDRLKAALADRYSIEKELGAGGMATVYLAEDLKHKRKVAVKVLRPELAVILGGERFLKESKLRPTSNIRTFSRSTTRARPMRFCFT